MSNDDRDLDILLRQNTERQLEGFDWDRYRQRVMQRLAGTRIQKPRRVIAIKVAAGVAALLMLAVGYLCLSFLQGTGQKGAAPIAVMTVREPVGGDSLLGSTDATTILLTGPMRWRVLNDPMLTPHSLWEQLRVETNDNSVKGEPI